MFDDSYSAWQLKGIVELLERNVPDTVVKGIITDKKWGISRSTLKAGRNRTVDEYARFANQASEGRNQDDVAADDRGKSFSCLGASETNVNGSIQ